MRLTRWPPVGLVRFGNLRRIRPISEVWGSDRGQPVDRYYITGFLDRHSADIRGRVFEIGTDEYTQRFGGDKVESSEVLHVAEQRDKVTIIGDLTNADNIPGDRYDCFILTQTLQVIYDVPAAIRTAYRILKPGGVLLATIPGISKISRYDMDRWGHFWSFTTRSAGRLFGDVFPADSISIEAHGNVLTTAAFLFGLSSEELKPQELDYHDPDYEMLITVRAVKPAV